MAAPFTGGASLAAIPMVNSLAANTWDKQTPAPTQAPSALSALGQTAGSIEQQRMNALIAEGKLTQQQDVNAQARAKLALSAPGQEATNAARGDVLANAQDATISGLPSYIHVPTISGGLRPSMLSANSRALGANMSRNALLNNLSGSDVPNLTPLPQANTLDKALSGVGVGSSLLGALGGLSQAGRTASQGTAGASSPSGNPSQDLTDPNTVVGPLGDTGPTMDQLTNGGQTGPTLDQLGLTPDQIAALLQQQQPQGAG